MNDKTEGSLDSIRPMQGTLNGNKFSEIWLSNRWWDIMTFCSPPPLHLEFNPFKSPNLIGVISASEIRLIQCYERIWEERLYQLQGNHLEIIQRVEYEIPPSSSMTCTVTLSNSIGNCLLFLAGIHSMNYCKWINMIENRGWSESTGFWANPRLSRTHRQFQESLQQWGRQTA